MRSGVGDRMSSPSTPRPVGSGPINRRVRSSMPSVRKRLSSLPGVVEDAQRRVACPGQVPSGIEDALEHEFDVQLLEDAAGNLQDSFSGLVHNGPGARLAVGP